MSEMKLNYFGVAFPVKHPKGACRVCGCTDEHACSGGCFWALPDICSQCVTRVGSLLSGPKQDILAEYGRMCKAEENPNVLALAEHNAPSVWQKQALRERLEEVQK